MISVEGTGAASTGSEAAHVFSCVVEVYIQPGQEAWCQAAQQVFEGHQMALCCCEPHCGEDMAGPQCSCLQMVLGGSQALASFDVG